MKRSLPFFSAFCLLVLSALCVSAQDTAPAETERTKIIKLEKYELTPSSLAPLQGIEIIVTVFDTTRIGYVQVGLNNKKIRALPEKNHREWLQLYVDAQYGPSYTPQGKKLICVVKDLRINERTFFSSEKAFVRLRADAWIAAGDDRYQYACSIDTVLEKGGFDVTKKHGRHIAEALHLLITNATQTTLGITESLSREDIYKKSEAYISLPVLAAASYPDGIYVTFEEFKNNTPSVTHFTTRIVKKKVKYFRDSSDTEIEKFWGLCKNNEVYRCFNKELIPLEKVDHAFIISTYLDAINRKNQGIFWGAVAGGLLGAAIGGASAPRICEVNAYPYLSKKPEASAIDMENGKLTF